MNPACNYDVRIANTFGARYYNSSLGRFMTPDPTNMGVDFENPQSWNRYAYVCAGTNRRKGEDERASPGKRVAPRPDLEFCVTAREGRGEA